MTPHERLALEVSTAVEANPHTKCLLLVTNEGQDPNFKVSLPHLISPHPAEFNGRQVAGVGSAYAYGFHTTLTPDQRKHVLTHFQGKHVATWLDLDRP